MEKVTFTNLRNSNTGMAKFTDINERDTWISEQKLLGTFGLCERWIRLEQADAFELSREDDRRTIEIIPARELIVSDTDENGNPVGEPYLHSFPAVTAVEIHVPDDFTMEITDITVENALEIKKRQLRVKKDMAEDVIIHINSIIDSWTAEQKIAILGRSDISAILTFLNYGSIEQSRQLVGAVVVDATFTQEIKESVYNFLTAKINLYNAMVWG